MFTSMLICALHIYVFTSGVLLLQLLVHVSHDEKALGKDERKIGTICLARSDNYTSSNFLERVCSPADGSMW